MTRLQQSRSLALAGSFLVGLRPLTDLGVFDMLFRDGPLCKNIADVCPRGRASVNWVFTTVHASFSRKQWHHSGAKTTTEN